MSAGATTWLELVSSGALVLVSGSAALLYAIRVLPRRKGFFPWLVFGIFAVLTTVEVPTLVDALVQLNFLSPREHSIYDSALRFVIVLVVAGFASPLFRDAFAEFKAWREYRRSLRR